MGVWRLPYNGRLVVSDRSVKFIAAIIIIKLLFICILTQERRIRRLMSSRRNNSDAEMGELPSFIPKATEFDQLSLHYTASVPSLSNGYSSSGSYSEEDSDSDVSTHMCYIVPQHYLATSSTI